MSVVMMRAPVMPKGCPSAIAPPWGFIFSSGMLHSAMIGITWAANASFSSTVSTSSMDMPARSRTFLIAQIGATPMYSGSLAAVAEAMMRARGFRPSSSAFVSDMTSTAAAPSFSGHELPAVTLPSSLKAGSSWESFSSVALGHVLRGQAHRDVGVRLPVVSLQLLVLVLRAGALDGLVVAGHPLHAGGDVGIALARGDRVRRLADRLEARCAVAGDGRAVRREREPLGQEGDYPAHVEALEALREADPAVDLLDQLRVHLLVALEQRVDDERAHLIRAELGQGALEGAANGCANGIDDHWFRHGAEIYLGGILKAPSSLIVSPFSIGFSTMWQARRAYSSGRPRRGGCGTCAPSASRASSGRPASRGVSNRPGAIVQTLMPRRARSRAAGRVRPTTPPFDAE